MQFVQDVLLFAIEAIVISTLLFIIVDFLNWIRFFGGYQIPANWQPDVFVIDTMQLDKTEIILATASKKEIASEPQADVISAPIPDFSDPWLVNDQTENSSKISEPAHSKSQHLLLLPPAKIANSSLSSSFDDLEVDKLLARIDLNTLKLRQARKIAKALGIAQKVNRKDQPLSWLKGQIQVKLQQQNQVTNEIIETVRELSAS